MIRASFRDPEGQTWVGPEIVTRAAWSGTAVTDSSLASQQTLDPIIQAFQTEGNWIPATPVAPEAVRPFLQPSDPLPQRAWTHPRLFFPSYAHEWSPIMLYRAAELTLDLNARLLQAGWELKDATPTNILFDGPRPILVDHLSPTRRQPGQMGWTAYGQFIRTFIIPLALHRLNNVPLSWIHLARRDGVSPEEALPQLSLADQMRPSVFGLITLPVLLSHRPKITSSSGLPTWGGGDESMGRTITARLLQGLNKRLRRWAPFTTDTTVWSQYDQASESYTPEGLQAKEAFIQEALDHCRPSAVLDLGCNTGRYSKLAARTGSRVVAVDGDPDCIDHLWRHAEANGLDILPLVMDLGRPSPALGWENGEEAPFLERAQGRFDMVLALALIHHLLVRERVPLARIIAHLAQLTTHWAIIEWIPPEDRQFQRLAGPNQELYVPITREVFEITLAKYFSIDNTIRITDGLRVLYLVHKSS